MNTKKTTVIVALIAFLLGAVIVYVGHGHGQDWLDEMGEGAEATMEVVEEAGEETGEAIEEAGEETGEAIEGALDEAGDAMDDAADAMDDE